jgi:hypothetical protein
MIWVPLALLVWCAAGVMLFAPRTRPTARSLALAMAGTFPGVFLFQLLAAPVVITILLGMHVFWKTLEPGLSTKTENPLVIVGSIIGMYLVLGIMAGMSLAGFCEGWRIGWAWAKGRRFRDVVEEGLLARLAKRFMQRSNHATQVP